MAKRLLDTSRQALYRHGHVWLAAGLMAVWAALGPGMAAKALLPLWFVTAQLIFLGSLEAARLRRRAWLGQYLLVTSPWHRWLRGGVLMVIRHQLLALLLALLLLVKLRLLTLAHWPVLLAATLALVLLQEAIRRRLERHVVAPYVAALARRLLVWPAGFVLALLLVIAALWLTQPYLVGLGWEEALLRHTSTAAGDSLLGLLERLAQALELTQYWAMQNALAQGRFGYGLALFGWCLLLFTQSAIAWAFVRLMIGADTLRSMVVQPRDPDRKEMG
ncbi:hypothetical protein ACOJCM_04620 [Billgrantia sp. LNSP4103-1]|uniref:hypothetical protein n=1 Tax=Billgrantia sp. LNSP4103-1 TaxID=3410266 RepID=UPI00403F3A64